MKLGVIALLVFAAGVAAGWVKGGDSYVPTYRAHGLLYVGPSLGSQGPRFEPFVRAQVDILRSRRLALLAMQTEPWKKTGEPTGTGAAAQFEKRRMIGHKSGTQHIVVRFADPQPETALAGVKALLEAYEQLLPELQQSSAQLEAARSELRKVEEEQQRLRDQITEWTAGYGGLQGLEFRHKQAVQQNSPEAEKIGEVLRRVRAVQAEIEHLERMARQLRERIARLRRPTHPPVRIVDPGSLPTEPDMDDRDLSALRGAAIGALPGFLLLLAALVRGRRRRV